MTFKFEKLEIWKLSVEYIDLIYEISNQLPKSEDYNLKSQIRRASTSIALNIAEGSTGQSNPEQSRFLSIALRSLYETVACLHLIKRHNYSKNSELLIQAYKQAETLACKIQAMRKYLLNSSESVRDQQEEIYLANDDL